MTLLQIALIFLYVYIASFIIVIIGCYIMFKGETLQEFIDELCYSDDYWSAPPSNLTIALMPGGNTIMAFVTVLFGLYKCITIPFKLINQRLYVWDRLKNVKIKKHK